MLYFDMVIIFEISTVVHEQIIDFYKITKLCKMLLLFIILGASLGITSDGFFELETLPK